MTRARHRSLVAIAVSGWLVAAGAAWGPPGVVVVGSVLALAALPFVRRHRPAPSAVAADRRRDPLAALPNRSLLLERLALTLEHPDRHGPVAVACLDIDRFRRVNEGAGHEAGDRL